MPREARSHRDTQSSHRVSLPELAQLLQAQPCEPMERSTEGLPSGAPSPQGCQAACAQLFPKSEAATSCFPVHTQPSCELCFPPNPPTLNGGKEAGSDGWSCSAKIKLTARGCSWGCGLKNAWVQNLATRQSQAKPGKSPQPQIPNPGLRTQREAHGELELFMS